MDPLDKDYLRVNDLKKVNKALYDTINEIVKQSVYYHSYEDNHLFFKKVHANIKCELTETQIKTAALFMYSKLREKSSSFDTGYCLFVLETLVKIRMNTIEANARSGNPYGSKLGNFVGKIFDDKSNMDICIWEKCDRDDAASVYRRFEDIYHQFEIRG